MARKRILVLNRWPQYPGGERWDNELARYGELVPLDRYRVTYICDRPGLQGLAAGGLAVPNVYALEDFADTGALLALAERVVRGDGPFDRVLAFSEYLLDGAALLRARFGIPGPRPEYVDRFRDKLVMKRMLAAARVRTPRWFACTSLPQVRAAAQVLGYPLILKPVRGASSKGVRKIGSLAELEEACRGLVLREHELEEFVAGDLLHVDGVVDAGGRCVFSCVSRYIAPVLEFESGAPLGSVIQTDPDVVERCRAFALRVLAALDLRASAFHIELFESGGELVFLEIGARVPGADVSYVVNDVCGVNLFQLWVDVVLGHPVEPRLAPPGASGGWLTIPRPRPLPRRVLRADSLLGTVPHLYRELVPRPGHVLEDAPGYANLQGGRFLFRGGGQHAIEAAIRTAIARYTLTTAPLHDPVGARG